MPIYKIGEFVVCGRDVYKVSDIVKKYRDGEDFYKLTSQSEDALTTYSPINRQEDLLRPIITKQQAEALIEQLSSVELVEVDSRSADAIYSNLVKSGNHEDIIKLIKTTYQRCEERVQKGAARPEKDKQYFRLAEKLLYSEFAIALGKTYEDTKEYIIARAQLADQVAAS